MVKRIIGKVIGKCLSQVRRFDKLRYFYLPNIPFLLSDQIKYHRSIKCNQRVLFTGYGTVVIGEKCSLGYRLGGFIFGPGIEIQARTKDSKIIIGNNLATNNNIFIVSSGMITIGDDCLIGQNVTIMDFEAHGIPANQRRKVGEIGFIEIKNNVWVGNNVTILKNSIIGNNVIVATGAVVSGNFPDNVIIGGVPAKIIKNL